MTGDGISFPVSEAVTGELYGAGQRAEANHMAGEDEGVHQRLVPLDPGAMGDRAKDAVFHRGTSLSSLV